MMKERLNYIKSGDSYTGVSVNIPSVVVQADSIEDLEKKAKLVCLSALKHMTEIIEQDQPFDTREITDPLVFHYGERDAAEKRLLQKYKDLYGEL